MKPSDCDRLTLELHRRGYQIINRLPFARLIVVNNSTEN